MNKNVLLIGALILGAIALSTLTLWVIPERGKRFAGLFQQAEYANSLPRHLLAKMAEQESNYDPKAESHAGAQGLMQIVPKWHPTVDPFNVHASVEYAGNLMREHYEKFGSWRKALAAYNAGPNALQKRIDQYGSNWLAHMPAETQNYVARIGDAIGVV